MPIGQHFKLSVSAGPDLIYAGIRVERSGEPHVRDTTQPAITDLYQKENTKILPGYYVDVDLRYDLTDTAGFYVGDLYQGGGSYSQTVPSGTSGTAYWTRHDRFRRARRASRAG